MESGFRAHEKIASDAVQTLRSARHGTPERPALQRFLLSLRAPYGTYPTHPTYPTHLTYPTHATYFDLPDPPDLPDPRDLL